MIDGRFVVTTPQQHEDESADPWRDPAIRLTNNGPHDYEDVTVEVVVSDDPNISAGSSPIYAASPVVRVGDPNDWKERQSVGKLAVGQSAMLEWNPTRRAMVRRSPSGLSAAGDPGAAYRCSDGPSASRSTSR